MIQFCYCPVFKISLRLDEEISFNSQCLANKADSSPVDEASISSHIICGKGRNRDKSESLQISCM